MPAEKRKTCTESLNPARLSAPPGFASLSSFFLKKVENCEGTLGITALKGAPTQEQLQVEAKLDMVDVEKLKQSVGNRPWILYDKSNQSAKKCQPGQPDKYLMTNIEALEQATAKQCPAGAVKDVLEDAPAFHPTEEEFSDTLKYIESIRHKAELYGVCRIIPPPEWQPPCMISEKHIWEYSKFVTQYQQFDKFPAESVESKTVVSFSSPSKTRNSEMSLKQGVANASSMNHDEVGCSDMLHDVSKPGPEFTLKRFKKYADDFRKQYFMSKCKDVGNNVICKQEEPSVESIEGEYRRIVENPPRVLEVLYGDNLDSANFGSGFPKESDPCEVYNYPRYVHSSWNLINVPQLPGSLLTFESDKTSDALVPRLRVGMCFSSLCWKVEEIHLYSLCYMHMGSPKIWYCAPGRYSFKFEAVMKEYLSNFPVKQFKQHEGVMTGLSPFMLKSEGIPVYRCIQYPREFVLLFPGAYHSAFDCGFNVAEAVNLAPLDWLPHAQNAMALYQAQRKRTSISFDKLLIEAARRAVRAQWELLLFKKSTSDNLRWKCTCGKNGILAKTLKSRIKQEANRRECLCATSQTKRMDKDFSDTGKRECSICFFDLYLSAVCCPCSADRYSCLSHAKRLCSCAWTEKIFLYRYDISELEILVEAVEGKLSAMYKWTRKDPNMAIHNYLPKENSCTEDKAQKERMLQNAGTAYGHGWTTSSSIKAEMKAHVQQSQNLNGLKSEENMKSIPAIPSVTKDDTSSLHRELMPEALSSSTSVSSSSESEETADIGLNGGKGCILSTSGVVPSRRTEREVRLSELLKDTSSRLCKEKNSEPTSKELSVSNPASKKRKK